MGAHNPKVISLKFENQNFDLFGSDSDKSFFTSSYKPVHLNISLSKDSPETFQEILYSSGFYYMLVELKGMPFENTKIVTLTLTLTLISITLTLTLTLISITLTLTLIRVTLTLTHCLITFNSFHALPLFDHFLIHF